MSNFFKNGFDSPAQDYADSFAEDFNYEMENRRLPGNMSRQRMVPEMELLAEKYGWRMLGRLTSGPYTRQVMENMDTEDLCAVNSKEDWIFDVYEQAMRLLSQKNS